MSQRFSGLEIEETTADTCLELTLGGELDIGSVPILHAAVARICKAGSPRRITLDLSGLTFIDSAGVAEIILTSQLSERDGFELALIPGPRTVQRLFEVTGLTDALPFSGASETR